MYIVIGIGLAALLVYVGGSLGLVIGLGLAIGLGLQAWDRTHRIPPGPAWTDVAETQRIARKMDEYAEAWRRDNPPDQKG